MQKIRLSWLAKGVAALTLALALVFSAAHFGASQTAVAHAAIVPAHDSQALVLTLHTQTTTLAPNACVTPLAAHTTLGGTFAPVQEPVIIVHPQLSRCLMPLTLSLSNTGWYSLLYPNFVLNLSQLLK